MAATAVQMRTGVFLIATLLYVSSVYADTVVIDDDLIVDGSFCLGQECNDAEIFGFQTIKLKGKSADITFVDTSSSASFPGVDWTLAFDDPATDGNAPATFRIIEGTLSSGLDRFVVENADTGDVSTVRITGSNQLEIGRSETHMVTTTADSATLHEEIMNKIMGLTVQKFRFTGETETKHIGFSAEDFKAQFQDIQGSGSTTHLDPLDVLGVALSGIKDLKRKLEEAEAKLALC